MNNSNLIPLEGKAIRKEWRDGEWYFSVVDVIGVLTDRREVRHCQNLWPPFGILQ